VKGCDTWNVEETLKLIEIVKKSTLFFGKWNTKNTEGRDCGTLEYRTLLCIGYTSEAHSVAQVPAGAWNLLAPGRWPKVITLAAFLAVKMAMPIDFKGDMQRFFTKLMKSSF